MSISSETRREIRAFLIPYLPAERRAALLSDAFYGEKVLHQVDDTSGTSEAFTDRLLSQLINYGNLSTGEHSLVALLRAVDRTVGADVRRTISVLLGKLQGELREVPYVYVQVLPSKPRGDGEHDLHQINMTHQSPGQEIKMEISSTRALQTLQGSHVITDAIVSMIEEAPINWWLKDEDEVQPDDFWRRLLVAIAHSYYFELSIEPDNANAKSLLLELIEFSDLDVHKIEIVSEEYDESD